MSKSSHKSSFLSCVVADILLVFLFQHLKGDVENILIFCPGQAFCMPRVDTCRSPAETAMCGFIYLLIAYSPAWKDVNNLRSGNNQCNAEEVDVSEKRLRNSIWSD